MSKNDTQTVEKPEAVEVYVPALGCSIKAVDQADVERQVKKALEAEEGDVNSKS